MTRQVMTGQVMTGQIITGQVMTGQIMTDQVMTGQARTPAPCRSRVRRASSALPVARKFCPNLRRSSGKGGRDERTGGGRGVSNGLRREKGRMDANTVRHVAHEQQQLTIFASDESHCLTRTQPESMLSLPVTISARTTTTAVRSGKRTSRNIFFDLSCAQTDRMNLPSLKILPDGCPQANRMATPPGMSCRESPLQSGLNSTR